MLAVGIGGFAVPPRNTAVRRKNPNALSRLRGGATGARLGLARGTITIGLIPNAPPATKRGALRMRAPNSTPYSDGLYATFGGARYGSLYAALKIGGAPYGTCGRYGAIGNLGIVGAKIGGISRVI